MLLITASSRGSLPSHSERAALAFEHRAPVQVRGARTARERIEQIAHHAGRGFRLDPARLAERARRAVRIERGMTKRECLRAAQFQIGRADQHAREQTHEFIRRGRETGFVEIVVVEIDQAVIALVAAEILEI